MTDQICVIILVALAAAFVVLLAKKWGFAEYMQVHGDKYMSRLFSCDLCMSFWAAVLLTIGILCVTENGWYIFVPVFSTPITRMLV